MIYLYAFLIGGLICMAGQLLMDLTKLTPARILVLFVCLGVVLGGLGWYHRRVYRLRRWSDRGGAQRTGGSLGGKT